MGCKPQKKERRDKTIKQTAKMKDEPNDINNDETLKRRGGGNVTKNNGDKTSNTNND